MRKERLMNKLNKDCIKYDKDIQIIANWLANGDRSLAAELRSEMHIALLTMDSPKSKTICIRTARCKAIDYLRSKSRHYSYDGLKKHVSLDALREAGFQIDTDGNLYAPEVDHTVEIGDFDDEQPESSD